MAMEANRRGGLWALAVVLLLPVGASLLPSAQAKSETESEAKAPGHKESKMTTSGASGSLHDLSAKLIDGKEQPFAAYKGKVLLIVNTASQCGFTPQYDGLEKLYQAYHGKGLVVLGFPSNEFGQQEPGTAQEIAAFCRARFGVTFPLFEKVQTKGAHASPVFHFLTAKHGEPQWNFSKYLVGKDGQVKQAFASGVAPDSKELLAAIDAALAAP
jgi:glutathione peroxidase